MFESCQLLEDLARRCDWVAAVKQRQVRFGCRRDQSDNERFVAADPPIGARFDFLP